MYMWQFKYAYTAPTVLYLSSDLIHGSVIGIQFSPVEKSCVTGTVPQSITEVYENYLIYCVNADNLMIIFAANNS